MHQALETKKARGIGFVLLVLFVTTCLSSCSDDVIPEGPALEVFGAENPGTKTSSNQIRLRTIDGEGIEARMETPADDPHINFYQRFDAASADVVRIEIHHLPPQDLELFWATPAHCPSTSVDCRLRVSPSSIPGVWTSRIGDHPLWDGEITRFRIDFTEPTDQPFLVSSLRFFSDEKPLDAKPTSKRSENKADEEPEKPPTMATHLFDLEWEELTEIPRKKQGGGLGATASEIMVVSGDGQVRIIDTTDSKVRTPTLQLPPNHEKDALEEARRLKPDSVAKSAEKQVRDYLRYDDILIFDDDQERHLVLSYSHFDPEGACFNHRISRLSLPRSTPLAEIDAPASQWQTVFSSKPCFGFKKAGHQFAGHQSGGRIALVDPDKGEILLALGDFEFDRRDGVDFPQDPAADYGKILRINLQSGSKQVVSKGHRNPQGITIDAAGHTWVTEHGPMGGDELNAIEEGANYGWPDVTLGIEYGSKPWPFNPRQGRHEGFRDPTFAWLPSIGISNLDQSLGFHSFWEEDLLVFTLNGYSMYRIRIKDDRVLFSEKIDLPWKERVRYGLNHAESGSLYLWADSGKLFRVTPAEASTILEKESLDSYARYRETGADEDVVEDEAALLACHECHSGGTQNPPALADIFGQGIAGGAYGGYSKALQGRRGVWDEETLKAYLVDPQAFAKGTSMPDPGIASEQEALEIIRAMKALRHP